MRSGKESYFGLLESKREPLPLADEQANGFDASEKPSHLKFNQALYQIQADWILGTVADRVLNKCNLIYDSTTKSFLDSTDSPVVLTNARIIIKSIDDLANEMLFTDSGIEFEMAPGDSIDLTTYNFKITGSGCRGNLNFTNAGGLSIVLEGSNNLIDIVHDNAGQAILKNGQDAIENGKIADKDAGRNLFFNAHPDVNQRGNQPAVPNSAYAMDGWIHNKSGAMVSTFQVTADGPTFAQAGVAVKKCIDLTTTTADTSIAAGDYCSISQPVEGYNILSCAGGFATLGFWVKSPVTGIHCVAFRNQGSGAGTFASPYVPDRSYVKEYTIAAANTWEFQVFTVPVDDSSGTWDYSNGMGLAVTWTLAAGTTYQTTAETWATGNFLATANQVNVVGVIGSFKVAIPKLLAGQEWQRFMHYKDEYYLTWYDSGGNVAQQTYPTSLGVASTSSLYRSMFIEYKKEMRTTPVVSITPSAAWTGAAVNYSDTKKFIVEGNALTTGSGCWLNYWSSDASIYI